MRKSVSTLCFWNENDRKRMILQEKICLVAKEFKYFRNNKNFLQVLKNTQSKKSKNVFAYSCISDYSAQR